MSSAVRFETWALPAGLGPPGERVAEDGWGISVVRADATAAWLGEVCDTLTGSRAGLSKVPSREIAQALGHVGARFLDDRDPLRERALELLPGTTGLSPQMCRAVLDGMARDWTAERLHTLVERELGIPDALDGFVAAGSGVRVRAVGPVLCAQVVSGSVPGVSATALIRSLLVKAPTLVKPGLGDVVLPVLFARGLAEADRRLADAVAVVYWPGGSTELEDVVLAASEMVVAYGSDTTVRSLRERTPVRTRFLGYHHRVSFGAVAREALAAEGVARVASEVAEAVAMFDQRGCVSPHIIWVEEGGAVGPADFAEMVAEALAELESSWPSGRLAATEASMVQQVRGGAELLRAAGRDVRIWHGGEAPWTVVFEGGGVGGEPMCVGRVVRLRPLAAIEDLPERIAPWRPHLQTVALAASPARVMSAAGSLAAAGVTRVTPFSEAAFPPAWWRQDGRGVLQELVTWVEVLAGE